MKNVLLILVVLMVAVAIAPSGLRAQEVNSDFSFESLIDRIRSLSFTVMTGRREVPGPGDSNGFGVAKVEFGDDEVCVDLRVFNIEPATMAHIHRGEKDVAGPVVVTLPTPNAAGEASGCVSVATELVDEIRSEPKKFYVNVHNNDFPGGAVRGQLR